ncbi:MAG: hypothetical protein II397_08830, partial [Treponema sp.]|nr:hypothetical protein [Treponema sp.]
FSLFLVFFLRRFFLQKTRVPKEHPAIFAEHIAPWTARQFFAQMSSRVFFRKPVFKNGREAIFEGLSGVPWDPTHSIPALRERLRRPSNPCRACTAKGVFELPIIFLSSAPVRVSISTA